MGKSKLYNKHEAAEFLGVSVSTLFYHRYESGLLPPGRMVDGRLKWTEAELEKFKQVDRKRGFKERVGDLSITVSQFVREPQHEAMMKSGAARFTLDGKTIVKIERDHNATRQYNIQYESGEWVWVWNNTRLNIIEKADSE